MPAQSPPELWLGLVPAHLRAYTPSAHTVPPSRNALPFSMWATPANLSIQFNKPPTPPHTHRLYPSPHRGGLYHPEEVTPTGGHLCTYPPPSLAHP